MQQSTPQAYLILQSESRWTEVFRLAPGQNVTIGRASDCQVVVREEAVSRQHAKVFPQNGGWAVADLGSRNGTNVNNRLLSARKGDKQLLLSEGDSIRVGACQLLFTHSLESAPPAAVASPQTSDQATLDIGEPIILGRRGRSQWSLPTDSATHAPSPSPVSGAAPQDSIGTAKSGPWSFFYALIHDLVAADSRKAAAQSALSATLEQLAVGSGGVVTLAKKSTASSEHDQEPAEQAPVEQESSATIRVLATHDVSGRTYRRISDFLVRTVMKERQAVLARNVQGDADLSFASQSAQQETSSVICAPLFKDASHRQVSGLLHIYTTGDERSLTESDLEFVVGVADNLTIALAQQVSRDKLRRRLENSQAEVSELRRQLQIASEMVGSSDAIQRVKHSIARVASSNATVLVRGESGVGKELVARAIHASSPRSSGPMVCLNCAALAPTLLESELFGHEKGSFTGATERKIGKFEAANNGTLFLDEIGEMPLDLQAKFLRVLEGQPFERLGGHKPITTDVRVVAATNRDLEQAIEDKEFRSDLYYRLSVLEIIVPPLRERIEDIPELVVHFIDQLSGPSGRTDASAVDQAALDSLAKHAWPGNVRELRNVIQRALVLGTSGSIGLEDISIPGRVVDASPTPAAASASNSQQFESITLAELERRQIMATLKHVENNKSKAARLLGIERSTLDRKLKRYQQEE